MSDQNDKKTAKTTRHQLQEQMKKQYDKYKMTIAGVERELVKSATKWRVRAAANMSSRAKASRSICATA